MARIHRKGFELQTEYYRYNFFCLIGVIVAAIGVIVHLTMMFTHQLFFAGPFSGIVIIIPGMAILAFCGGKRNSLKAGIEAEEKTMRIISRLPESYTAITNVKVAFEGKVSEMDMVVAGPTGVFVIETKSRRGDITGDADGKYLYQTKGNFETYTTKFYNPMKQVGTHVFRLSNCLKKNGINMWVQGVVFFNADDVDLDGYTNIPYFTDGNEMLDYIIKRVPKEPVTEEMINKTLRLFW